MPTVPIVMDNNANVWLKFLMAFQINNNTFTYETTWFGEIDEQSVSSINQCLNELYKMLCNHG